jgi:hypothetical protein
VLVPVLLVAAGVQAVQQHAWASLAVLTVLAVVLTVHPVAAAALSQAGELAADKYAAGVGSGPDLASALAALSRSPSASLSGLRARHPPVDARIARLTGERITSVHSVGDAEPSQRKRQDSRSTCLVDPGRGAPLLPAVPWASGHCIGPRAPIPHSARTRARRRRYRSRYPSRSPYTNCAKLSSGGTWTDATHG